MHLQFKEWRVKMPPSIQSRHYVLSLEAGVFSGGFVKRPAPSIGGRTKAAVFQHGLISIIAMFEGKLLQCAACLWQEDGRHLWVNTVTESRGVCGGNPERARISSSSSRRRGLRRRLQPQQTHWLQRRTYARFASWTVTCALPPRSPVSLTFLSGFWDSSPRRKRGF